jgi:uncharacterized protein HemX
MLFLLAAVVVGLIAVGVIHFQKNGDNVNISIDENKLRQTTAKVVREGEQVFNQAEQSIQQDQPGLGQRIENGVNAEAHRLVPQTQQ